MATRKKKTSAENKPPGDSAPSPGAEAGSGYTALARRYRSRDFDELIGQEPIARTLQNAVKTGRTAHAYLFCGTRGVGKTSMARIFAKALNATDDLSQKDAIADAILRGEDLDVIEIDGASNRGIADAKELIAGAGLSATRCRFKIYIIDEVHALTKDAFNALLKTMEEPPSHVKFILCTTEAHKVPQTIQSRCQRFDFRPIPTPKIADQLRRILKAEKIQADDDVVHHVAQLGNGSMRDALSLLDRLLAAADGKLTGELLEQMIGMPDQHLLLQLADAILAGNGKLALETGSQLLNRGAPIEQVLDVLADHFRSLMILATCGEESELLEISPEAKKAAIKQSQLCDAAGLVHLIAICDAVSRNARTSSASRALFDAAIVRMAMSDHLADIASLMRGATLPNAEGRPHAAAGKKKAPDSPTLTSQSTASLAEVKPPAPSENPSRESFEEVPKNAPDQTSARRPLNGEMIWQKLQEVASRSAAVMANVNQFRYHSFDGQTLLVEPESPGAMQWHADMLASVIQNETGRSVQVRLTEAQETPKSSNSVSERASSPSSDEIEAARQLPAVRQAMDIFDATIVDVRDRMSNPPSSPQGEPILPPFTDR